jgi:hypothetical protein
MASQGRSYSGFPVLAPFQLANKPSCGVSGMPSRTPARPTSGSLATPRQVYARPRAVPWIPTQLLQLRLPRSHQRVRGWKSKDDVVWGRAWRTSVQAACLLVEHVTGTLWALIMGPQPEEGTYTVDLRPSSSHHPERVKYTTRRLPVADSGQHDIDKRIHWLL